MSSIEPGGVFPIEATSGRHRLLTLAAIGALVLAGTALFLEPYFVFDRIGAAVSANDLDAQRELVDPGLIGEELPEFIRACQPESGRRVEKRYDGLSRFLVISRPAVSSSEPPPIAGQDLRLVLERRGLSWRLADVLVPEHWGVGFTPGSPGSPRYAPGDSLPEFGTSPYVEELPEPIAPVAPRYPADARRAGVEGTVMISALIGRDGLVRDTRVLTSIPLLDSAAVTAVRQWRFKPARSAGSPIAVWVTIPVRFTLH